MSATKADHLIMGCAFKPGMTISSERLVIAVGQLKGKELRRAKALMRKLELPRRMAHRAVEVANFNQNSAIRIVNSMQELFRPETVTHALEANGYTGKLSIREIRHRKGGNAAQADLIATHLRELRARSFATLKDGLRDPRREEMNPPRSGGFVRSARN